MTQDCSGWEGYSYTSSCGIASGMTETFYLGSGGEIIDLSKDSKAGYIKEQVGNYKMGITYDNMDKKKQQFKDWRQDKLKNPEKSEEKPIKTSYTYEF